MSAKDGAKKTGWTCSKLPVGLSCADEARVWSERAQEAVDEASMVLAQVRLYEWFEWLRVHPALSNMSAASGLVVQNEAGDNETFLQLEFTDGSSLKHVSAGGGLKVVHTPGSKDQEPWSRSAGNQTMVQTIIKLGECVPDWDELLADTRLPMEWAAWRDKIFTPEEVARQEHSVMMRSTTCAPLRAKRARL